MVSSRIGPPGRGSSVGLSQVPATIACINNQEGRHRKVSFMQEFVAFLKKHNLEYDERYVFG